MGSPLLCPFTLACLVGVALDFQGAPGSLYFSALGSGEPCMISVSMSCHKVQAVMTTLDAQGWELLRVTQVLPRQLPRLLSPDQGHPQSRKQSRGQQGLQPRDRSVRQPEGRGPGP